MSDSSARIDVKRHTQFGGPPVVISRHMNRPRADGGKVNRRGDGGVGPFDIRRVEGDCAYFDRSFRCPESEIPLDQNV